MIIFLVVLSIIGFIVNTVIYFLTGMSVIRGLIIYFGFMSKYAKPIEEYGIRFKPLDLDLWEKTEFDDYEVRFYIADKNTRESRKEWFYVDKYGRLTKKEQEEEYQKLINELNNSK